ncbi:DUF302 domain-containing protein [Thermomicrobiaceae bacterium CFH 74404]|uniref:DUF302 domain-containing protein n=1 Tax=Thermalbibacter longus TaxID=2951981 RepID=A0AA42BBD0_9BACT|nr:DUF302 domain-containing protein [Thermalbibacter longus]MCM8749699.1 DUF302 domain-containing protein [Thermalbibacter longus]
MVTYGFGTSIDLPFDRAVEQVQEALKAEGFGVLAEIDVQRTLREKLGKEMERYLILGACNPQLAHQALDREREIGLLLPCNVVVREVEGGSWIGIADPQAMLSVSGNPALDELATEAKARLQRALGSLARARTES